MGVSVCLPVSLFLSFFGFVCTSLCVNVVVSLSFVHVYVYDLLVFCSWGCVCVFVSVCIGTRLRLCI